MSHETTWKENNASWNIFLHLNPILNQFHLISYVLHCEKTCCVKTSPLHERCANFLYVRFVWTLIKVLTCALLREEKCWVPCVVDDLDDNLLQKQNEVEELKTFGCKGLN